MKTQAVIEFEIQAVTNSALNELETAKAAIELAIQRIQSGRLNSAGEIRNAAQHCGWALQNLTEAATLQKVLKDQ